MRRGDIALLVITVVVVVADHIVKSDLWDFAWVYFILLVSCCGDGGFCWPYEGYSHI
jgi:hypothetical protein